MKCLNCNDTVVKHKLLGVYYHTFTGMASCEGTNGVCLATPVSTEQPAPPFAPQMLKPSNYERYRAFLDDYKALCEKYNLEVNVVTDNYGEVESMRIETLHLPGNEWTVVNEDLEPYVEAMKRGEK